MTQQQVNDLQWQYDKVSNATASLASKEGRGRAENVALTHLETALLWLGANLQQARMLLTAES